MDGLKLFLIFVTLLLLRNGAISQDPIPPPEDLGKWEAKLERKQILTQLLDLKSYLESQFLSISALDKRLANIERLLTTREARTNQKIDELGEMLQDLGSKKPQDGPKSRVHEQMWTSKSGDGKELQTSSCKVSSIKSVIPNLEVLMADIKHRVGALQNESLEERAQRAEYPQELVMHLEELHTAVDPSSAYLHYRKYENSLSRGKVLEMLITDPKATFFKGENLTGDDVNYDSSTTTWRGGCHYVKGIQSMRVSESCIRVFKGDYCDFISRALYPKPNSGTFINFLTPELEHVKSVGPCLPNEFQLSTVSLVVSRIAVTKGESNVRQVPDFVDFFGWNTFSYRSTSISSSTNPVKEYYMDEGRPKWIYARVEKRHLKGSTESDSGMNMAIPPELGGPTYEAYNFFNQTSKNFEEWKRLTDEVIPDLQQSLLEWVDVSVTFIYESPSAPNTYGFYYWINANFKTIVYGFIEN